MTIHTVMGEGFANRLTTLGYTGIAAHNGLASTSRCIGNIRSRTIEDRCIIESSTAFAAGHLIPLASVRGSNHAVRNIRLLILRGVEHIHRGLLSIRASRCGADMTALDLSALQLEALHMRHIVAKAPIRDLTTDGTGNIGRSGSNGRYGIAVEGCAVSRGYATKGTANESGTTAEAHSLTALHNGIPNIGVGIESGSKACSKTCCRCSGSGCDSTTACTAEYTACRSGTAANTGDNPGGHHQFHAHAGSGLGYIQAHRGQITVKSLGTLQVCQSTEHPEEDTAFAVTQCTAVSDELAHRRSEAAKEPDIHDQEQQLGTNHSAPGLEHSVRGFGSAHGEGKG